MQGTTRPATGPSARQLTDDENITLALRRLGLLNPEAVCEVCIALCARTIPGVGPFVGDAPEDRHAERVVREMLSFLDGFALGARPDLFAAMIQPVGGSVKAQQRFLEKVRATGSPAIIDIGHSLGKRCRFSFMLSLWETDKFGGATVFGYTAVGSGPGHVERRSGPIWRLSHHALVRLVQRSDAHDALKLLAAMRALASPMIDAIADHGMLQNKVRGIKVPFPGGVAVVKAPSQARPRPSRPCCRLSRRRIFLP